VKENWGEWLKKYRERLQRQDQADEKRKAMMDSVNPKFVLRNHLAQRAIQSAEKSDYSEVNNLLNILSRPFDEQPHLPPLYSDPPGEDAPKLCVSCSS